MARPKNQLTSEELRVSASPELVAHLERLVSSGLYGKNPTEAAGRLIEDALYELMKDEVVLTAGLPKRRKT